MKTKKNPFPVDVVYTWKGEDYSDNPRLGYNNELKYSLRSVAMFAPWVRKIYILMNTYKPPSWIKPNSKIIVLEHKDTFPSKKYLPNTNSSGIETTLCNIKGLSEHYIYFNDDVFLGNKVKYTDFFTPDGKAIIDEHATASTVSINKLDSRLSFLFPPNVNKMHVYHIPVPQIKSLVRQFNTIYSDYIDWIRSTRTRNGVGYDICTQYKLNFPCQQTLYPIEKFMASKNKTKVKNFSKTSISYYKNTKHYITPPSSKTNIMYLESSNPYFTLHLNEIIKIKPAFFCINDTVEDSSKRSIISNQILQFCEKMYPKKASFEI